MKLLFKLTLLIASNALAVFLAYKIIPGFNFYQTSLINFVWVGLVLGIVNSFLSPIIKLLTFPIRLLSLGLFTLLINLGLLYLVAHLFDYLAIETLYSGLGALIIISLTNYLISSLFKN